MNKLVGICNNPVAYILFSQILMPQVIVIYPQVDYGSVLIPKDLTIPAQQTIPGFTEIAHGVHANYLQIIDAKTIKIVDFTYDGQGPGKTLVY